MELHRALGAAQLTTLRLQRSRDGFTASAARDFDPDRDFAEYGVSFQRDHVLARDPLRLGDDETRAALAPAGAALAELEAALHAGDHEQVVLVVHAELGVRLCHHVHSSSAGRRNGLHALRLGGMRRHDENAPEHEVLMDGLNLSRAMSFKNAAAGVPFGGSKTTVQCAATGPRAEDATTRQRLGFLAWCIDIGQLVTGPDMGFEPELIDVLNERHTRHIAGGPASALGHTGTPTARGVLRALEQLAQLRFGPAGLSGRTVAIQGIGAVGSELARSVVQQGASLLVADTDERRVAELLRQVPARALPPESVLSCECDVLCPCAGGGVLSEPVIDQLRCALVCGAANNQLAAHTRSDDERLADRLAQRGVLFHPDWSYTMGGVLAGVEAYVRRDDANATRVAEQIDRVCGDGTRALAEAARAAGTTATRVAYERWSSVVFADRSATS